MKILVIGSGGREHTLVWKLAKSNRVSEIFCAPGNGGTSKLAKNIDIAVEESILLADFAKENNIDLTVVGPEVSLANGIVDEFNKRSLRVFGPTKDCARLESSKVFAKEFMKKHNIPTASFEVFNDKDKAISFVEEKQGNVVIKADGLAAGKGVFVCSSLDEARQAINTIMVKKIFSSSGDHIVIEDKLLGEEASMIVLYDGATILPFASSQDHKAIFDNDQGPNTGGMGAYSPAPVLEGGMLEAVTQDVLKPIMQGLEKDLTQYRGVLYIGLMITDNGSYVLEFNVRFGDPEIQAIAPRLKSDLVDVLEATVEGKLNQIDLEWDNRACVCVVMASSGYPDKYEKGKVIEGLAGFDEMDDVVIFHAGTKLQDLDYTTSGGRVLGVTALGDTIEDAIKQSYEAVSKINFEGAYFRKDIGKKALNRIKNIA